MASSSRAQSTAKAYHKGTPILLANSPEQIPRAKVCSHYDAKLDKNRIVVLFNSTIICHTGCCCHLIVISPAVSELLSDRLGQEQKLDAGQRDNPGMPIGVLGFGRQARGALKRWQNGGILLSPVASIRIRLPGSA